MGVISLMERIVKPIDCNARNADSRPDPGPFTLTSSSFIPCSCALRPAFSAVSWAAYGVDFRDPLKPIMPAEHQDTVLPCASVMVMMVLLKVEFTCAIPEIMFFRSFLRPRGAPFLPFGAAPSALVSSFAMFKSPDYFLVAIFLPAIGLAG